MSLEPQTKRILVVDDDSQVRSSLKRYFAENAWHVETAGSGQEALNKMAGGELFKVIVADYFMPNVNGIDFLKRVNLEFPDTYCIMLTSYPYCDSINYAMRKYLKAELLQKPWDERLLRAAEEALDSRKVPDETPQF